MRGEKSQKAQHNSLIVIDFVLTSP